MKCIPKHLQFPSLKAVRYQKPIIRRITSSTSTSSVHRVPLLPSWDPEVFQIKAYIAAVPFQFPRLNSRLPPACSKWFTHENEAGSHGLGHAGFDDYSGIFPRSSELNSSFWTEYADTIVPLELTSTRNTSSPLEDETFQRTEAPLGILLAYLSSNATNPTTTQDQRRTHSIYLAQCSLTALPPSLQQDIPTPDLITRSGPIKGDIYASSLWIGRPPTYTPLHRDPNPNIFIQLAGQKVVRLLPPEVGGVVFADVQARIQQDHHNIAAAAATVASSIPPSSAAIRGEEMMSGPEKSVLHAAIWPSESGSNNSTDPPSHAHESSPYAQLLSMYVQETTLGMGDALFIPKGWWHSVKGIGAGVTASANWWFR